MDTTKQSWFFMYEYVQFFFGELHGIFFLMDAFL
jgi:hypothetical protein